MSHITLFAKVARASLAAAACLALANSTTDAQVAAPTAPKSPPIAPAPAGPAAETRNVQHIVVLGTQRIEPATVLSYISIHEGDVYSEQTSDLALKTLYQTGLFADVKVKFDGTTLTVSVVENPIINQIEFEGNSKVSQKDLEKEVQLKPRTVFTRSKVQADVG
jgi:outer membrane protein insertion porin family